jgi:YegS/Rv2252/BmrU family lipid kinase
MTTEPEGAPRRAAVVFNPSKKGTDELTGTLTRICAEQGWAEPLWLETTVEDPGAGQARAALEAGADVVIAAGGDGTVREVASELAGTDTPLGVIPLGTGNLLARNLGIVLNDLEAAARQALESNARRIDVVRATIDHSGEPRLFLVMAGLGFDAAIMADTKDALKDRVGWLAYVDAGIRNLPGTPIRTSIRIDGKSVRVRRLRSFMVGNCGKLQGGFEMFPGAKVDDGLLDLMTIAPKGRFGWLGVLAGLLARGRENSASVEYFRGKSVELSTDNEQDIQLDGDTMGRGKHLELEIDAGALTIRVPQG